MNKKYALEGEGCFGDNIHCFQEESNEKHVNENDRYLREDFHQFGEGLKKEHAFTSERTFVTFETSDEKYALEEEDASDMIFISFDKLLNKTYALEEAGCFREHLFRFQGELSKTNALEEEGCFRDDFHQF